MLVSRNRSPASLGVSLFLKSTISSLVLLTSLCARLQISSWYEKLIMMSIKKYQMWRSRWSVKHLVMEELVLTLCFFLSVSLQHSDLQVRPDWRFMGLDGLSYCWLSVLLTHTHAVSQHVLLPAQTHTHTHTHTHTQIHRLFYKLQLLFK